MMLKKIASLLSIILIVVPIALSLFNANSKEENSAQKIHASKKINQIGEYSFGNKNIIINNDKNNGIYFKNEALYTPNAVYNIKNVQVIKQRKKYFLGVGIKIENVSNYPIRVYEDKLPYRFMKVEQSSGKKNKRLELVNLRLKKEVNSTLLKKKSTTGVLMYRLKNRNEVNLKMLDKQSNEVGNMKFNVN